MKSLLIHSLLFACMLFPTWEGHAQYEAKDFIRYTVREGLSDNNISCIEQDEWGFIWVGTEIGLNRFDGNTFENFFQGSPSNFLAASNIRKLKALKDHRLAIATKNGLQVLRTSDGSIQNFIVADSTPFVSIRNQVWDMHENADRTFAVTTSAGFYVFDSSAKLLFRYDAYGLKDIGQSQIFYGRNIFPLDDYELIVYVEKDKIARYAVDQMKYNELSMNDEQFKNLVHPSVENGGPWISKNQISDHEFIFLFQRDSIIYYNTRSQKKVASPLPFHWAHEFSWQSKVLMEDDSTFLINGGYSGFYRCHLDRLTGHIKIDHQKFLNEHKINCLWLDKEQRLWVGTTKGLLKQNLNPGFITKYDWKIEDFSNDGYSDGIFHKNMLYLSRFSRDVGLVIIDTTSMQIVKQIHFYGKGNGWNEVSSIQMYHPDTLWMASYAGLLWFDLITHTYGKVVDQHPSLNDFPALTELAPTRPDGYAWMCSYLNPLVAKYHKASRQFEFFTNDSKPALPFNRIKNVAYDAYGDVWISGHSLARWNNREHYFDTLITVYGGVNKYNDDISVMQADDAGSLWIHNVDNGLLQYRIREKEFVPLNRQDGLPSEVLRCFSPVIDNILWMGSHNHLVRLNTETKKIEVYGAQDGVPDNIPIARAMFADPEGRNLFMLYKDEVISFPVHPEKYINSGGPLMIRKVVINNNQSYSFPESLPRLKKGENNLSVYYTIIDFEGNPNYQFAYKLNDAEWASLGQQRSINLSNLAPGFYNLELSATGKSGELQIKSFSFHIAPPFWKTGWFVFLCVLAGAGCISIAYWMRMRQIRKKAVIDQLLSKTEMKALHAQMNPHFIFNSLNSIREMILNGENREASRFLSKFAHLIRLTLDQSGQTFISLRNTVDYLNRYVEMEKIRNANFHCEITVDPVLELDETVLPPMLIQPFIENSIWHGTNGKHKQIDIQVKFEKKDGQLICIVDDNGIGINRSLVNKNESERLHHAVGISNIRSRIQLLNTKHHLQSSINVEDKSTGDEASETGTRVTLRLPLEMSTQ